MKPLKPEELRQLSLSELHQRLQQERERLFQLRQNKAVRKLSDTASIRITRHNIARLLTIITEKQRAQQRSS
ncbi:MAG: 50S ribosomal protein L29 [Armatimonadota bacterium]|nr:50S ribosomal protein L29 [bacterium]MDW8103553.1 50S ribosomal protein L29 [Armatimonadota bacterium]MDW8291097.1 50S ribosomal protein L29 [Armatimonadota bacterium]